MYAGFDAFHISTVKLFDFFPKTKKWTSYQNMDVSIQFDGFVPENNWVPIKTKRLSSSLGNGHEKATVS